MYDGDEDIFKAVESYKQYIMNETLAVSIERVSDPSFERFDLNDHETGIKVERV